MKTLFLCRYLGSEAFRREVHDGLNVVETWNGTKGSCVDGGAVEKVLHP